MLLKKIVRHAPSLQGHGPGKVQARLIGDHLVPVDPQIAAELSMEVGHKLGAELLRSAMVYSSGYMRTRLTFLYALAGAKLISEAELPNLERIAETAVRANEANKNLFHKLQDGDFTPGNLSALIAAMPEQRALAETGRQVGQVTQSLARESGIVYYEDPRLREVHHGRAATNPQTMMQIVHTSLFYRFDKGGEHGGDAYNQMSGFRDSVHREAERRLMQNVIIFGHSLSNRIMVMSDLHLSIEDFQTMKGPEPCGIYSIAPCAMLQEVPQFTRNGWGVSGVKVAPPLL